MKVQTSLLSINPRGGTEDVAVGKHSTSPVLLLGGGFCALVFLPGSMWGFSSCCSKMTHRCRSSWSLFSASKSLSLPSSTLKGKKMVVQLIYVTTTKDQSVWTLNPASCCIAPNRGKRRIFHASEGRNPSSIVPDDVLQICKTELTNKYSSLMEVA